MSREDIKICESYRKLVDEYHGEENPHKQYFMLGNILMYMRLVLREKFEKFLLYASPNIGRENIVNAFLVTENAPDKLKEFLEQQTA